MAGTVVPGTNLRMLRQYSSANQARIPHVATPHGGAGPVARAGHEGGGNPMAPRGTDSEGHLLPPLGRPGTLSGIIGRMMDKADIEDFNKKVDVEKADKTARMQSTIDTYDKAIDEGKNKNEAFVAALKADNHAAFLDPDVLNALGSYHKNMAGSGEWGIKPLGEDSGYSVIQGPGGESQVVKDQNTMGKIVAGPGGSKVEVIGRDPGTGQLMTRPIGGLSAEDKPYDKPTPAALRDKVQASTTILRKVEELSQNVGAAGSLGWGKFEQVTARNTPFGGQQGQAYAGAYAVIQPAIQNLTRVVGMRDTKTADAMRQMLPDPTLAKPYLVAQAIPQIRDLARHVLAQSYTEAKGGHKDLFPDIASAANTFDATPARMDKLDAVKQKLQTYPGSLDPGEMSVLQREFAKGRLTASEQERTGAMMAQHGGVLTATQLGKLSQAYPGIAQKVQQPEFQLQNPAWKKPMATEPATEPQPIQAVPTVPPVPGEPGEKPALTGPTGLPLSPVPPSPEGAPNITPAAEPSGNPPPVQEPPAGSPGLLGAARGALNTLNEVSPVEAAPRQPPLGAPALTPTEPPASASAPIPPVSTPTQPPGKQSGLLDMLNPIGSAQAAETPTQPPYDALRTTAVPEAGDERVSASAPIPPQNPIASASAPIPQPGFEEKATSLFRQIHDLLSQYRTDEQ